MIRRKFIPSDAPGSQMPIPPSQGSVLTNESCRQDSTTSVLIVADVRLYREGLAGKLSNSPGLVVMGTASTRQQAHERAGTLCPDVVLIDVATVESLELIH